MNEAGQNLTNSRSSVNSKQDTIKEMHAQTNHNPTAKTKNIIKTLQEDRNKHCFTFKETAM